MEPMTLGSPGGGGSPGPSPYLPSFLMGEPQAPTTPRNNTLSPNKGGRSLPFAASPGAASPQDYNRSALGQKTLFGGHQQTPPASPAVGNYAGMQSRHNASLSGPPTQGLFDSLRESRDQVQASTRASQPHVHFGSPVQHNSTAYGLNQSYLQAAPQGPFNDSYLSNASFNASRAFMSPSPLTPNCATPTAMLQCAPLPHYSEFWVTVYGFPPSATSSILQHFAQCGTVVEKVFPPQNGNWVHLKYASRLECDKALNYNEKILGNNIMIGVTQCKDRGVVDKENLCEKIAQPSKSKVRPLAQTAYKSAQNDSAVLASPGAPQKSSGLVNRAMDLFFGW